MVSASQRGAVAPGALLTGGADTARVLIIDDEAAIRTLIRHALKRFACTIHEARDGEEGIEVARRIKPDVIICDVFMPGGLTGYEVLETLHADPATASTSVILMTGNTADATFRRSMNSGADDYLPKPFTVTALTASVEAQLQKRRRAQDRNAELEARLLAVFEATTDLVAMIDCEGHRILYLNRAGRAMLGLPENEDVTTLALSAFHPAEALQRITSEALPRAMKEGVWSGETPFRRRDGSVIITSQVILAHHSPAGQMEYLSTIARDISAQKKAERERDMMELQLRHAQKLESIGQLAAGIAHEINTPTQYIGDNIRFLSDGFDQLSKLDPLCTRLLGACDDPAAIRAIVAEINDLRESADLDYLLKEIPLALAQAGEGVDRVTKIVRAMKQFSHPGGEDRVPTDINRAVECTLTVCRNEWKYHADLVLDLDPELPQVPCVADEFNQVILNLVINAAHAIADATHDGTKGTLTVSTRRNGDWVEVRVSDSGGGIPENIRSRIFEPFFTTKAVGRGTGQGLAISRSVIVDKHGGTLEFDTKMGHGTTFIIRLPLEPPALRHAA